MQQFVYVLKPTRLGMLQEGSTDQEAAAVLAHVEYLMRQTEAGRVLLSGRTQTADEETFGIVILQAESEKEARAFMKADPAVVGGAMTAKLYPYAIATVSEKILKWYHVCCIR